MPKPQFSLKAMLIITAALSVPLGMIATENVVAGLLGVMLLFPALGGCVGYLAGGWQRVGAGVPLGIITSCVYACFWPGFITALVNTFWPNGQ